ncbi:flagellin N-terminal helical domain-containing protein [Orenia marismortui]|uniref:flagellin N-terminal helical domain-containing protein n=1 Tax=Orenia marismortui TaxID=46469 RepID=UPI00037DF731|nr:flagellin [Orenia marismortui]
MRINHNISSMNALRQLHISSNGMDKSMEKLSSGYRINRAADDAAGLAISEKMRGQIGGLEQASRNAQDGISLIQTAEGALQETHNILGRMRDLAVQAKNGTNTSADVGQLDKEFQQLKSEINRIASQTEFNTKTLIGSTNTFTFQIGANSGQTMTAKMSKMTTGSLSVATATLKSSVASTAIANIDKAIESVSGLRANLGAVQNRLEHTIANLDTTRENLQASESRIRDVDMAKEMSKLTKNQILQQAGTAMLAQANQKSQGVLQLLG